MFKYEKKEIVIDLDDPEKLINVCKNHLESEGYSVVSSPYLPKEVSNYLHWSIENLKDIFEVLDYKNSEYPARSLSIQKYMSDSAHKEHISIAFMTNKWGEIKENKLFARTIGYELLEDEDDGYWNYDGSLFIGDKWNDLHGYKTSKMTKDEWYNLGINESNAVFEKDDE